MDAYHRDGLLKALESFTKILILENETASIVVTEYGARILGVFLGKNRTRFGLQRICIARSAGKTGISEETGFEYPQREDFTTESLTASKIGYANLRLTPGTDPSRAPAGKA